MKQKTLIVILKQNHLQREFNFLNIFAKLYIKFQICLYIEIYNNSETIREKLTIIKILNLWMLDN